MFNLDFITDNTRTVLEKLSKEKFIDKFTLVGGTALSLQILHRLSEDLDFMLDGELLDSNAVKKFIDKTFAGSYKLIKQDNEHQLDFIINNVKVTFFTSSAVSIQFQVKDYSGKFGNINIATPLIISILKLNAIAQRNTIRDYYDLYFIAKNIVPLKTIFDKSRELLPNIADITYSETIIYTEDLIETSVSEHLKPKENISKSDISDYFTIEIKKIL
jgi:predicted nucleotidyltransferase component of viral defense system